MPDEEKTQMQDAELHTKEGLVDRVKLPAFPNNPDLVAVPEGILTWGLTSTHYFAADSPVVGFGRVLFYHEVYVYELGGSDA